MCAGAMHLRMIISFVLSAFVSAAPNTFLPNDTNIYYSPYAWNVEPTQAATINSAASVRNRLPINLKILTNAYQIHNSILYRCFCWQHTCNAMPAQTQSRYIKFLFSGSFLNFRFNVSHMATPASEVYWRVDNGPMTPSLVLDTVSVAIPPNNTKLPYHR